jgi:hypothetical protein
MSAEIASRKSALAAGAIFYFTGMACKRGHVTERYAHNGECVVCAKLRARQWKKTVKGSAYQAEYRRTPKMREYLRDYKRRWQPKRRAILRAERLANR